MINLHSVSPFGDCLDDKLPVLLTPSSHLYIRRNDRTDIVDDIFLLTTLAMEGHSERCQRLENGLYVDLGTTCHTNV